MCIGVRLPQRTPVRGVVVLGSEDDVMRAAAADGLRLLVVAHDEVSLPISGVGGSCE